LEKLSKENPDEFAEKMEQIEKRRIEERSTLRHKNTSRWAKEKAIYAKFNNKGREEIEEQLKLGKKLRTKAALSDDDDDDDEVEDEREIKQPVVKQITSTNIPLIIVPSQQQTDDEKQNPWLNNNHKNQTVKQTKSTTEYSKPTEIKNSENDVETSSDDDDNEKEEEGQEQIVIASTKEDQKQNVTSTVGYGITHLNMEIPKRVEDNNEQQQQSSTMNSLSATTRQMNIQEAFADDDVIAEFDKEKNEIAERDQPKSIDLSLPGWGDWGGSGVVVNRRRKQKFIIKPPPAQPRKDVHLHHVIINQQKDKKITPHLVNKLPFPYVDVEQYETTIKQPLGKEWNPECAFRRLNQPKIRTLIGTIIEPLNKDELFDDTNKKTTAVVEEK